MADGSIRFVANSVQSDVWRSWPCAMGARLSVGLRSEEGDNGDS